MAVFKCKMCGGELNAHSINGIVECEYCGSSQTISKSNDEDIQNLFNKANNLRRRCEFDKALVLYDRIISECETDAEGYYGALLCKYGIEYVDDPATNKKIPTCHRASYESIKSDDYYVNAIKYANLFQKELFENETNEINRLQKEILLLSEKEDPYDVFICYKESDEHGERTVDSVIANEIYHELTDEGFKVFYSAITLESKLGEEYEPIIFGALTSAKVMLVIGTKPEYFNAVWVRNEWSRFLKMVQKDRSKKLIPCYKDMDPYDLPEEFAHLQAQNMSKIGFITDVIRGIEKLVEKDKLNNHEHYDGHKPNSGHNNDEEMSPLLRRAFIFLEDKDFVKANEYAERVLDEDPEDALAYLVKLLVSYKVSKRHELGNLNVSYENNLNYEKIMRYGDEELKREVNGNLGKIKNRLHGSSFGDRLSAFIKEETNNLKNTINAEFNTKETTVVKKTEKIKVETDEEIIKQYNEITLKDEEIKKEIKKRPRIKNLLLIGVIFCFVYWPVGLIILLVRSVKINKEFNSIQERNKEIIRKYKKITKK